MATVAAVGGLALSAYKTVKGGQDAARARGDAASAANKAAALAQYNPDVKDYQDANYDERKKRLGGIEGRAGEEGFRKQQAEGIGLIADAARGNAPSVAEQQLQAGQDTAANNALALAQQQGGGALGLRSAIGAGNSGALQTNQQAGLLRAQEVANARNALVTASGQGRAADLNQNTQLLQIAQQYAAEDERNRQALIKRHELIGAGRRAAAGARSAQSNQLSSNADRYNQNAMNSQNGFVNALGGALTKAGSWYDANYGDSTPYNKTPTAQYSYGTNSAGGPLVGKGAPLGRNR